MKTKNIYIALIAVFLLIAVVAGCVCIHQSRDAKASADAFNELEDLIAMPTEPTAETSPIAPTVDATAPSEPVETVDPELEEAHAAYEKYKALYEQNNDFIGWISIEDTNVNYPVMQFTDNPDFYLKHGFDKAYSNYGVPYLDEACATGLSNNIVLDPVFIFGWCGLPAMGIAGAAIATVIGQWSGALLGLYLNEKHNPEVQFGRRYAKLDKKIVGAILTVGIPSIVMNAVGSVMNFGMNQILQGFNETATSVFGIYFKLQSFFFMPLFGLNGATISIIAFNYGARKPERIVKTLKLAVGAALTLMICGLLAFQLVPDLLLGMFNPSDTFLMIGRACLRTISWSFPMAAVCIVLGAGGVAAVTSWLMITTLLNTEFVTTIVPSIAESANKILAFEKIENPFIGIIAGLIGSHCYNRFKGTKLPDWLSSFSGKRSAVIVAGVVSIITAVILLFVWPLVFGALIAIGETISNMGAVGAGIYVCLNRLLIPTGLHHALNNVFWYDIIGLGDLGNYWAGKTSADVTWSLGMYMAGFFPCMIFGIPGPSRRPGRWI